MYYAYSTATSPYITTLDHGFCVTVLPVDASTGFQARSLPPPTDSTASLVLNPWMAWGRRKTMEIVSLSDICSVSEVSVAAIISHWWLRWRR